MIFIYDTDVKNIDILEDNIDAVSKYSNISNENIIFLQSNKSFEDEIVRCCSDIKTINDLFGSKGSDEFKHKFSKHKDIASKLKSVGFDLTKMWSTPVKEPFNKYKSDVMNILEKK